MRKATGRGAASRSLGFERGFSGRCCTPAGCIKSSRHRCKCLRWRFPELRSLLTVTLSRFRLFIADAT